MKSYLEHVKIEAISFIHGLAAVVGVALALILVELTIGGSSTVVILAGIIFLIGSYGAKILNKLNEIEDRLSKLEG